MAASRKRSFAASKKRSFAASFQAAAASGLQHGQRGCSSDLILALCSFSGGDEEASDGGKRRRFVAGWMGTRGCVDGDEWGRMGTRGCVDGDEGMCGFYGSAPVVFSFGRGRGVVLCHFSEFRRQGMWERKFRREGGKVGGILVVLDGK